MKKPNDISWITSLAALVSCIAWAAAMLTKRPEDECIIGYVFLTGYLVPVVWVCATFGLFTAILLVVQIARSGFKTTFGNIWTVSAVLLASPGLYFAVVTLLSTIKLFPVFLEH